MSGKQFVFKILLTGDGAVGKTSIRERYMGKGFSGNYLKTIGADFASKKVNFGDHKVTYQIFDLAGQDAYVTARKSFYKGGQAAFLVFDLQDPETLTSLGNWIKDCMENSEGTVQTFIILGNKADLVETRQVSNEMAVEYIQQLVAQTGLTFYYMETSAKTGMNIDLAFRLMGQRLLKKHNIDIDVEIPDNVYEIGPGMGSGNVEKEVAEAVETVVQASDALIGGIYTESGKLNAKVEKLEKAVVKLAKKTDLLDKKLTRLVMVVKSLVAGEKETDLSELEKPTVIPEEEEAKEDKTSKQREFGVPPIPKK
ncbi:MAG: GTP-binding protein [Methanobacteriota archaeon]|nr:MAG: GTP-binding protein [Euryarchaeota archaeon]